MPHFLSHAELLKLLCTLYNHFSKDILKTRFRLFLYKISNLISEDGKMFSRFSERSQLSGIVSRELLN